MGTSERFDELKKEADKAPVKHREALNFLKNHIFKFNDEYSVIGSNDNKSASGRFKIIPLSFKVMYTMGMPVLYMNCQIVFLELEFEDKEIDKLIKHVINLEPKIITKMSSLFRNAPFDEFNNIKKFINMGDIRLYIDDDTTFVKLD